MKNEKFAVLFLLIFFASFFFNTAVFAESSYVLPYPSSMPGSMSYKIHVIYEAASKYWYFGDFGQFDYSFKMADKYLVEAKTLFEYKQYLLGYKALKKSDQYFVDIFPNLVKAKSKGKDTVQKRTIFNEGAQKHIEVLQGMVNSVPDTFEWEPEKSLPTTLELKKVINESILLRGKNL